MIFANSPVQALNRRRASPMTSTPRPGGTKPDRKHRERAARSRLRAPPVQNPENSPLVKFCLSQPPSRRGAGSLRLPSGKGIIRIFRGVFHNRVLGRGGFALRSLLARDMMMNNGAGPEPPVSRVSASPAAGPSRAGPGKACHGGQAHRRREGQARTAACPAACRVRSRAAARWGSRPVACLHPVHCPGSGKGRPC